MSNLTIFLLGHPRFFLNNTELTFNTRKDYALLAYLAVTGTAHSREALAELFWPDLPEANARRNLRHTLFHLQKILGSQWLETEHGVVLSQVQSWSVDVQMLRTTLKKQAANAPHARDSVQGLETLDQVLQLYRGEFLQGFHLHKAIRFEEWVLAQREELQQLALRGLEMLADAYLAQGAYEPGLTATRRLLQLEPWSEPAHCLQMQLLAQSGRRAEALAHYETCRQILAAELGIEPLPTTTAIYQQIKAGKYNGPSAAKPAALPVRAGAGLPTDKRRAAVKVAVPNNLLAPLAEFVGRQAELALIEGRLSAPACRLLTIVGAGGMGKTSLAQAVGQRLLQADSPFFPDGLYFVTLLGLELETRVDAGNGQASVLLATTIAKQIGCDLQSDLHPQVQLQNYLRNRRLLLILDNFEHLLAATDTVLALLAQAPQLTLLITSRVRLNLRGETVLLLDKLSLPAPLESGSGPADWQASEALAMFVQRAQCLDPHFTINAENLPPIIQVCQLVDGLPLGIELATSMLSLFSCAELAQELRQSLAFLQAETHDLPVEQRSLRAVFERSWRLLTPPEQALLASLSVWVADFHWQAAQAIATATPPLLTRLIHHSLVTSTPDGRYRLHPVVRTFALEKLEQNPTQGQEIRVRYARFYLDFLVQKGAALKGADLVTALTQINRELENIRLAWHWATAYQLASPLIAAVPSLFFFYDVQGVQLEAIEHIERDLQPLLVIDTAPNQLTAEPINLLIAYLQISQSGFALRLGAIAQADRLLTDSFARLRRTPDPFATASGLMIRSYMMYGQEIHQAHALALEAVQQATITNDLWLTIWTGLHLGEINQLLGNYTEALAQYTRCYRVSTQAQFAWGLALSQRLLGRLHLTLGQYAAAESYLHNCIAIARHQNLKVIWIEAYTHLGDVFRLQGRMAEAQAYYGESRQHAEALPYQFLIAQAMWSQGTLAEEQGDHVAAQALFAESMTKGHPILWVHLLPTLGWALIGLGQWAEAQHYFEQVLTNTPTCQFPPITLDAQVGLGASQLLQADKLGNGNPVDWAESQHMLHKVYHHPAATAETRQRIVKLATQWQLTL